jgi:hypothetical protein
MRRPIEQLRAGSVRVRPVLRQRLHTHRRRTDGPGWVWRSNSVLRSSPSTGGNSFRGARGPHGCRPCGDVAAGPATIRMRANSGGDGRPGFASAGEADGGGGHERAKTDTDSPSRPARQSGQAAVQSRGAASRPAFNVLRSLARMARRNSPRRSLCMGCSATG